MDGSLPRLPPYEPTDELRLRVRRLAMLGVAQGKIAKDLGISLSMLRYHYTEELEKGDVDSVAAVAGALFNNAVKHNNVIAQIFYLKSRHGWIDRKDVNHNHTIGPQLTHEERLALLEAAPAQGPKGSKFLGQVLTDCLAEEVPAHEDGGQDSEARREAEITGFPESDRE